MGSGDAELVQSLEELKQTLLRSKTEQDALKKERDEAVAAKVRRTDEAAMRGPTQCRKRRRLPDALPELGSRVMCTLKNISTMNSYGILSALPAGVPGKGAVQGTIPNPAPDPDGAGARWHDGEMKGTYVQLIPVFER